MTERLAYIAIAAAVAILSGSLAIQVACVAALAALFWLGRR